MGREMETYMPKAAPRSGQQLAPDPLAEAIIGSWQSPFLTVSFRDDGTLTARTPGGSEQGAVVDPTDVFSPM
jgi:hypothetical protein